MGWEFRDLGDRERANVENDIFRLIGLLSKAVSGNWMIKTILPWKKKLRSDPDDFDETNRFECIEKLENLNNIYNVDITDSFFIVTNKNGIFHGGYTAKWIMCCSGH